MILHYLKIAWRNLLKYRTQSAVSILGLAVGLACFALSAFWMHYEMTYDTFHRDADRLYVARVNDGYKAGKMTERLPVPMAAYLKEHYPEVNYQLVNVMDEYNAYLKAEHLLMRLLAFVSTVCILVSAFGIFSMITLSCERRRKEVAIRKVNGARVGDILSLFAREYLLLLAAAAVVAFPVGYVLMKRWLESYVEQTPLSWWLYAVIFLGMALLVALCIGWRVWRAANENPAEVVKRE